MVLGAARILAERKDALMGRIVFVFQPAEEITSGAVEMLDDGLYDDYPPDRVIGLHLWNQIPMGEIGVNRGTVFASADAIRVKVRGRGGHGALPHLSVDPVVAAAQIITAAQTVVSREVPPNDMGVLTFGQIHGGTTFNVIPDEVIIEGTIRAYTPEIRTVIFDATTRIVEEMGKALRVEATFERVFGTPAVINDPETASWVASQAMQVVGEDAVGEVDPVSVGDDMAEFVNRTPGCYFLLGAAKEGAEGHHNAKFDFDEACLPIGTEIFVRAAVDMLGG
jgi:amidohydrolase